MYTTPAVLTATAVAVWVAALTITPSANAAEQTPFVNPLITITETVTQAIEHLTAQRLAHGTPPNDGGTPLADAEITEEQRAELQAAGVTHVVDCRAAGISNEVLQINEIWSEVASEVLIPCGIRRV